MRLNRLATRSGVKSVAATDEMTTGNSMCGIVLAIRHADSFWHYYEMQICCIETAGRLFDTTSMPSRGAKNGKQRGSTLSKPDKRFQLNGTKQPAAVLTSIIHSASIRRVGLSVQ
jgi:hypothetical protein